MKSVKTIEAPYVEGIENLSWDRLEDTMRHKSAMAAIDSVNWPEAYPYAPECSVRIARGDSHLAVMFDVTGKDLRAVEMSDNGRSWEDSCCEVFLSADGKTYFNIEVTCIGSVLIKKGTEIESCGSAGCIIRQFLQMRRLDRASAFRFLESDRCSGSGFPPA
ncbi:MAG: hypothetical protein MJY55_06260 [Bacteroidales bacterium]|nr:hypothetical protein [Bacteroidales bacterium]